MVKRQILLLAISLMLALITLTTQAQELTIKEMQATNDLSASQYRRMDRNNEPCGLVKVRLATMGAQFEGNVIPPVEYKTGEYWVYMSKGSRELRIKHPSFVPLHVTFADYGIKSVQSLTTYNLTLLMPQAGMDVDDGNRFLAMSVEPANAIVYIDNDLQVIQNGTLSILLPMGQHQYRVESPAYETKNGTFIIGNETLKLNVKLESAMPSLNINSTTQGTQIYVNDQLKGITFWTGNLPPGIYRVEGRLQNYYTHRQSVTLAQNDNKQITIPKLQPKTGTLSVNYQPLDAEVWIDGQKSGSSPNVFRKIAVGKHVVELKKSGFITNKNEITIEEGKTTSLTGSLSKQETGKTEKEPSIANSMSSNYVKFTLYGTELQVRFDGSKRVKVDNIDKDKVAECMEWLESTIIDGGTLQDCLDIKEKLNLCDWAYLKLLDRMSSACLGETNESTILMTTLFLMSGYTAMLLQDNNTNKLRFCYHSNDFVYRTTFFEKGDKRFFLYGNSLTPKEVKSIVLNEKGKPVDLKTIGIQKFAEKLSPPRTICSQKNPAFSFTFNINKNLIDFYNDYPNFGKEDDIMAHWEFVANLPLESRLQNTLVKEMKEKVKGMSQKDAVQQLLWWTQGGADASCFKYADDNEIWGYDRVFFAEETLFYPFNDTEDRAILFSRLVRDIVGLDVLLIYYPGHLATAVCFTDAVVEGDSLTNQGKRFVVCDPTYVGSTIGMSTPGMMGQEKAVKLLKSNI